ncbi:MAG: alpha/beta hydrolase, partial [Candidatus Nitrosopolaris sp.]
MKLRDIMINRSGLELQLLLLPRCPPHGFILNTAVQQNKVGISWLTTNWSGICEQLRSISKPTLVIAGTDDVVPVANSLVIAAKIP